LTGNKRGGARGRGRGRNKNHNRNRKSVIQVEWRRKKKNLTSAQILKLVEIVFYFVNMIEGSQEYYYSEEDELNEFCQDC